MDYDELVQRLQAGHDSQCAMSYGMHEHCCDCSYVDRQDAADAITALQARASELATACARERNNVYTMVESCKRAESDLAAARALLREVHNWMPKGNRKLFERIDAALAGEKK